MKVVYTLEAVAEFLGWLPPFTQKQLRFLEDTIERGMRQLEMGSKPGADDGKTI